MCRLVFLSWLQFVQCLCILFLFYLTVLIARMICFYYNVCDCHAFIKGNLLTYLLPSIDDPAATMTLSERSAEKPRSHRQHVEATLLKRHRTSQLNRKSPSVRSVAGVA